MCHQQPRRAQYQAATGKKRQEGTKLEMTSIIAESKSSGAVLDVLLNKEVLSIIFEFVPVVEKVFDSAEFNNVLAFQVVSKTWKAAIGNCDNVWTQFFFRKFALCIRNGYTAYTRKTSGTIEDWQLHGYTWKPSVNSFSLNKQALFLLALLDSDPNGNHLDKDTTSNNLRGYARSLVMKQCKFASNFVMPKVHDLLDKDSPLTPVSFSFLVRNAGILAASVAKVRKIYADDFRRIAKASSCRLDVLLWVAIHRNSCQLLCKMIHDHNVVLPFASVNEKERDKTKTSSQERVFNERNSSVKGNHVKTCSKNYQWDDILMLFVPFSSTNFMFPYGQFVLKHELDRLADVIKKILMIRKLHPKSTMESSTPKARTNAIDSKQQKDSAFINDFKRPPLDVIKDISEILFQHCYLEGSDGMEYYKRENSYLDRILLSTHARKGIPISLSIVFLAVTQRLGLKNFYPVGMPGHFILAYQPTGEDDGDFICGWPAEKVIYIDAYDKGKILSRDRCFSIMRRVMGEDLSGDQLLTYLQPAHFISIIVRISANLCRIPIWEVPLLCSLYSFVTISIIAKSKQSRDFAHTMDAVALRVARLQITCRMLKLNKFIDEVKAFAIFPCESGTNDQTLLDVARSDAAFINQMRGVHMMREWIRLDDDKFGQVLKLDMLSESNVGLIDIRRVTSRYE